MEYIRAVTPRMLARVWSFVALLGLCTLTYCGVYYLRMEGSIDEVHRGIILATLPLVIAVKGLTFPFFRIRVTLPRYLTFHELATLFEAATISSLIVVLLDFLFFSQFNIPRSVIVMDWGATVLTIGGVQAAARCMRERYFPLLRGEHRKRALIVGANDNGAAVLQNVKRTAANYHIVGFVDDDPKLLGTHVGGIPVLGLVSDTCVIARSHGIAEVLVTAGAVPGRKVRGLVEECRAIEADVKMLPSFEQLLNGKVAMRVRDVSIEDLLRREPAKLETDNIRSWLEGRTLMITGSAGSIGSEICRQLLRFGPRRLVLVDRSENGQFMLERELRSVACNVEMQFYIADLTDGVRMRTLLERTEPDVIFHAAAYKHVPLMEVNPGEAVKNNIFGTRQLADLADEFGLEAFVMISTDKAVNPTSVMGACKRVAEMYVQSLAETSQCRFVTVRFGNVLDSAGSVVPIFRAQIARGGPITITDPRMTRFFMTIPEAAQLVVQAGAMGQGGEIFVLDMGEPMKIMELAEEMIRLSGLRVGQDIEIETIGLRPGEKLFEELHIEGEEHLPTRHPKIVVAMKNFAMTKEELEASFVRLAKAADETPESVVAELRNIVAEYRAQTPEPASLRLFAPRKATTPEKPKDAAPRTGRVA